MQPQQAPAEPPGFADMLVATRAAAGLSQEALAERSGMSVRAISDLERGRVSRPRRSSVELLSTALGLTGEPLRDFLRAAGLAVDDTARPTVGGSLCTLPPASGMLVGRTSDLAAIQRLADLTGTAAATVDTDASGPEGTDAASPGVVLISGQPGVGKTTLAVAAGHQLADRYPDGQLFITLRGADAAPVPPAEALARLLTALDSTGSVPQGMDERIAMYHALLHGRRMLIILDNAVDEAQIRPLLPGGACLALVTSRRRLAGLQATERIFLDVLTDDDAAGMLARIVGPDRCAAEPDAARRLAADCGRLPLALRIAANRLASRPHWSLQRLVDRLGDQHRRLDELTAGDLTVRGPFEISYEQLRPGATVMFRRLPLLSGPDFDATLAAPLLDVNVAAAEDLLEELVEASLLEPAGPDRYRLHDLVKLFAARKMDEVDRAQQREAAADRLARFVLTTAIRAGAFFEMDDFVVARLRRWHGGRPLRTRAEAARWLAVESTHWLDALDHAAAQGWHRMVVDLGEAMHWYSDIHFQPDIWPRVFALTTEAARAGGLRAEEAAQRNYLGWAFNICQGRVDQAMVEHQAALEIARGVDDPREQAWSLLYIGTLHFSGAGAVEQAISECRAALDLMSAVDDQLGTAMARFYLGVALHAGGRHEAAEEQFRQAEAYHRSRLRHDGPDGGAASNLAHTIMWRARNLGGLGASREAVRAADEAVARFRAQRNSRGVARALMWAAEAETQLGDLASALRRLDDAAALSADLGATLFEAESLLTAAELYDRAGDAARAAATRARAVSVAEKIDSERGRRIRDRALGRAPAIN